MRTELRVAICSCSARYDGKLDGHKIELDRLVEQPLKIPLRFKLQGVLLGGSYKSERNTMRLQKCHFFVDTHGPAEHSKKKHWETQVCRNLVVGKDPKTCRLFIGGAPSLSRSPEDTVQWRTPKPPRKTKIILGIQTLLKSMTEAQLHHWLEQMTL